MIYLKNEIDTLEWDIFVASFDRHPLSHYTISLFATNVKSSDYDEKKINGVKRRKKILCSYLMTVDTFLPL